MAIHFHPDPGTVLICDFNMLAQPEMTKRRPVVVLSPRFRTRDKVCTVVPLSTTRPRTPTAYHCELEFDPTLPAPYDSPRMWVKGDMLYTVNFNRLFLPCAGKDAAGERIYDVRRIADADLKSVRQCVLYGVGLGSLTQHL